MRRTGNSTLTPYCLESKHLSTHRLSIHTPFLLMHGREARLPLEVEKAQPIADTKQLPEIDRRIDQLTKLKDKIFPAVMANIDMAQTKQKEQYCQRKGLGKQEIKARYHATSCVVVSERQLYKSKVPWFCLKYIYRLCCVLLSPYHTRVPFQFMH